MGDRRQVALLTLVRRVGLPHLRHGDNTTRQEMVAAMHRVLQPFHAATERFWCAQERHADGSKHLHVAVKLSKALYMSALHEAFLQHEEMFVDVQTFQNYAKAVEYISVPSAAKPVVDLNPLKSEGHPGASQLCPKKRRQEGIAKARAKVKVEPGVASAADGALALPEGAANPAESPRVRLSNVDVFNIVKDNGLRSDLELLNFANEEHEKGRSELLNWVLGKTTLPAFVQQVWRAIGAARVIERSRKTRLEILAEASAQTCVCSQEWIPAAEQILDRNDVDSATFKGAVLHALRKGAAKFSNVFVAGPGNCGKTFLLQPLEKIYRTFVVPGGGGQYRLAGIVDTEVTVWQDVRWADVRGVITWSTLLVMLEGGAWTVPMPQNVSHGDYHFDKATPVFMTGPALIQCGDPVEDAMVRTRFQLFELTSPLPIRRCRHIESCPRCFARWILGTE
jgi:hypothetical protein